MEPITAHLHSKMMRMIPLRGFAVLSTVAALSVGCGRAADGPGISAPGIVRVGLGDRGQVVALDPGDRLILSLGPEARWRVATYPEGILSLRSSDGAAGRFEFLARAKGEGRIVILGDDPRPQLCEHLGLQPATPECPVFADGQGAKPPLRPFSFVLTVRVGPEPQD